MSAWQDMALAKSRAIRSDKVRKAAKGEECTLEIPGACNHNPETVVLCHLPDESHGMGRKSDDIAAVFGCSGCHDALDGRTKYPLTKFEREWFMRRALIRTWRRLVEKGVIRL